MLAYTFISALNCTRNMTRIVNVYFITIRGYFWRTFNGKRCFSGTECAVLANANSAMLISQTLRVILTKQATGLRRFEYQIIIYYLLYLFTITTPLTF